MHLLIIVLMLNKIKFIRIVENKLQNKIPFELQLHFGMYLSNFKFYEHVVMLR